MILVDVNLPVHAVNLDSPFHPAARDWWDEVLSGIEPVCLPWITVVAFVRITTNRRILPNPLSPAEAFAYVDSWFGQSCVRSIEPLPGHWELMKRLLDAAGTAGNLTTDAHLAALAIQHGCEVCSTDTDFARFPRLRWWNPLTSRDVDGSD